MIKLTVCVGFLAVFGFVAYALVVRLTRQNENKSTNKPTKKTTQK